MSTKVENKWFTIFEYEKEQEYLREMHNQGWKLVRIEGLGKYCFEECEPEDVIYQLDYNKEGSAHKAEYIQMFKDCGWEYMFEFVGYSYFRKPASQMNGPEEIFCDEESRKEMMNRVMKGRLIPILCIFSVLIAPQMFHNIFVNDQLGLGCLFLVIFILYLISFLSMYGKYKNYFKQRN